MIQPEDTRTLPLPLPMPVMTADQLELGDIARSLAGLPSQQDAPPPPAALPAWRVALHLAIKDDPAGKKGVAERLGVSRPYVSRVATGDLARNTPVRFINRVEAVLMTTPCPHLQRPLPPGDCRRFADRNYDQISQFEVDHWRACRACPHNHRRNKPAVPTPSGVPTAATTTATTGDPA